MTDTISAGEKVAQFTAAREALRAALAAGTPGPWEGATGADDDDGRGWYRVVDTLDGTPVCEVRGANKDVDATKIALAVNLAPALLDALDAAEALVTASQAAQVTQTKARIEAEERANDATSKNALLAKTLWGISQRDDMPIWIAGLIQAALTPRNAAERGEAHWIGRCEHDRIIGAVCFQCPRNHARPMSTPDDPAAIRDAALEEAAKACEAAEWTHDRDDYVQSAADTIAESIRALKTPRQGNPMTPSEAVIQAARADRDRAAQFLFHNPEAPRVREWVDTGEGGLDFEQVGALAAQFAAVRAESLLAHDAAGKVEWTSYGAGAVHQARVGDLLLHVESAAFGSVGFGPKSTDFRWKVVLFDDPRGTAPTLELAKAAAEAAAGAR